MSDKIAIKVENLSKAFKLPHEKSSSIKGGIINLAKGKKGYEIQQVLKNVNFEVKKGEFFGIVGRNGSGKSTLLKLLAGIYAPDSGNITINGKLTPFIELGVGFNPELTGRENVFLNGALLGFSRKEVAGMYEEIVEFAELERFMDQKLKNYSSGMQVRLAFSIAIRANTEILVLDEVLAVGDENFQRKCMDYFVKIKNNAQTVVLVTHDMANVERFCDRVLILNEAEVVSVVDGREASIIYQELNFSEDNKPSKLTDNSDENIVKRWGNGEIAVKSIKPMKHQIKVGQPIELEIRLTTKKKVNYDRQIVLGLAFYDLDHVNLSGPNSKAENISFTAGKTSMVVNYKVNNSFNKGIYKIDIGVFDGSQVETYDYWAEATTLNVIADQEYFGKVILDGEWRYE